MFHLGLAVKLFLLNANVLILFNSIGMKNQLTHSPFPSVCYGYVRAGQIRSTSEDKQKIIYKKGLQSHFCSRTNFDDYHAVARDSIK